jgi:hypothetical protein
MAAPLFSQPITSSSESGLTQQIFLIALTLLEAFLKTDLAALSLDAIRLLDIWGYLGTISGDSIPIYITRSFELSILSPELLKSLLPLLLLLILHFKSLRPL